METPKTKFTYEIGQKVTFQGGTVGTVISLGTFGNKDIRPPFNRKGLPTVKGDNFIGRVNIIPESWENHYNETSEAKVVSVQ